MRRTVPIIVTLVCIPAAFGQQAVSARAGLIQYVEGRVLLNDQPIAPKVNEFLQVDKGQTLATEDGRAEVLLTPGAFLRLSENSSFHLISSSLSDTRLEVVSGSAMVEVEELLKDNAITLQAGDTTISLKKHGLYRIDAEGSGRFRVYDGEAVVTSAAQNFDAKKGREVELGTELTLAKFDVDETDPFYRWSERRAGYIATANVSSARSVLGSGYNSSGYNSGFGYSSGLGYPLSNWTYNPWFGMFTFVPTSGFAYSPFGYAIYSPVTVRQVVYVPTVATNPTSSLRTITPPTSRAAADGTPVGGRTPVGGGMNGAVASSAGGSSIGSGGASSGGVSSGGVSSGGGSSASAARSAPSAPAASAGGARSAGGGGARGR